ncbi:MAG: hypothetical protein JWM06_23, partial [Actinomycetia bacterium]|nr:hypothetical protein [Actinomycetes bacterium]
MEERYAAHQRGRTEFVFGADERAALLAERVGGPGLRVLDLGCRSGALTQHYTVAEAQLPADALMFVKDTSL